MSEQTATTHIDVLVIGAGINGAGLFRDLCEQGVSTVIIDKADFGSGTSSAPSRLIHGGVKYLETGELRLVAQSTFERNLLLRNAPHLVKPLRTIIPMFSWFKGIRAAIRTLFGSTTAPRSRGALLIEVGLALYDIYGARRRVMPRHRFWTKRKAKAEMPLLTDRIVAAGTYFDALITGPERLVFELVQDGLKAESTSQAFTYVTLDSLDGNIVHITDSAGKPQAFQPRIVVNATGPWIDDVNATLGVQSHLIGGTKGSHIVLDNPELVAALNRRMVYYEANDGRVCLVFDYLGRALVGSTDIRANDPDTVRCTDEEINYFLESLRGLLPNLNVSRDQIIYTYSGIRPLPTSDHTQVGLITRDHSAPVHEPAGQRDFPVFSLVGGKWTTFRGFAEEVCDTILQRLGRPRLVSTEDLSIGGGTDYPTADKEKDWIARVATKTGATQTRTRLLLERYGSMAQLILLAESDNPTPLQDAPGYSLQEIETLCQLERIERLDDIVLRRTTLAITGYLTLRNLEEIATIACRVLGWSRLRKAQELEKAIAILKDRHGLTFRHKK